MGKEKDLIERIAEARVEAIKRGIEANTVIISEYLRYAQPFEMAFGQGSVGVFPPMIMGMEIKYSAELPHGVEFLIFESKVTERDKITAEIKGQAVKEFAEKLKEQMELNGYRSPLHNRIIDNLITELYGADE